MVNVCFMEGYWFTVSICGGEGNGVSCNVVAYWVQLGEVIENSSIRYYTVREDALGGLYRISSCFCALDRVSFFS